VKQDRESQIEELFSEVSESVNRAIISKQDTTVCSKLIITAACWQEYGNSCWTNWD